MTLGPKACLVHDKKSDSVAAMDDNLRRLLRQKLADGMAMPLPVLTRRDTWIPRVPGKSLAIGW